MSSAEKAKPRETTGSTVRIFYAYIAICAVLSGFALWSLFLLVSPPEQAARPTAGFSNSDSVGKPNKGARNSCAIGGICP
ncbi:hypothetical protein ASC96_08650 [Rhizobium sp. Root1204]|nr:hypothetical protein ASC96_08650 [Rhizobium sp. Root1204]